MFPVLFTFGALTITSFGLFLLLGILTSLFIIWRLALLYDLSKEKILDAFLLTISIGLIGSRVLFIFTNPTQFTDLTKVFLINKYPGLSFWGSIAFCLVFLYFYSKRQKIQFWQIIDLGILGLFAGLIFTSIGCALSSCQYGYPSTLPISITQVGLLEKRFPIQLFEALFYTFIFIKLWKESLQFHFIGKIGSLGLIYLSISRFFFDFFRADLTRIALNLSLNQFIASLLFMLGIIGYYHQGKRSIKSDLLSLLRLFTSNKQRKITLVAFKRGWYNLLVNIQLSGVRFRNQLFTVVFLKKNRFLRRINVKPTPKKF